MHKINFKIPLSALTAFPSHTHIFLLVSLYVGKMVHIWTLSRFGTYLYPINQEKVQISTLWINYDPMTVHFLYLYLREYKWTSTVSCFLRLHTHVASDQKIMFYVFLSYMVSFSLRSLLFSLFIHPLPGSPFFCSLSLSLLPHKPN